MEDANPQDQQQQQPPPPPFSGIKPPNALNVHGNVREAWKLFKQKWTNYTILTQLERQPREYQCAMLLHALGDDALMIYNGFGLPEMRLQNKSYRAESAGNQPSTLCEPQMTATQVNTVKQKSSKSNWKGKANQTRSSSPKMTSLLFTKRKRMRGALWLTFLLFQDEKPWSRKYCTTITPTDKEKHTLDMEHSSSGRIPENQRIQALFNYTLTYRPGSQIPVADALLRAPLPGHAQQEVINATNLAWTPLYVQRPEEVRLATSTDP
ncbi:hypothetical protein CAPTEDRAFT_209339 [Capitella teleta]|uniref:Uncharacterized protein n=1 Tax=Capitella teleta TaxID=283909 RepID=R7TLN1_CAPTE|nr:hypothetical protein CAPTEDRAFT_209339 [Capitella teleta]|eukprot:ELT92015.1 hypothetical protein CAPTEDRAFT_209339 [Capitella teleta]